MLCNGPLAMPYCWLFWTYFWTKETYVRNSGCVFRIIFYTGGEQKQRPTSLLTNSKLDRLHEFCNRIYLFVPCATDNEIIQFQMKAQSKIAMHLISDDNHVMKRIIYCFKLQEPIFKWNMADCIFE